jgi:RNA polymerase sigma-70 factor, ECF subfamily
MASFDAQELLAAGQAAWPDLHVEPERFARFVAEHLDDAAIPEDVPAGDLYLACACADGDPSAIQAFERRYSGDIDAAVAKMGAGAAVADEVKQILRSRFFVAGREGSPAIADFAGRGDLHGWVRVSAVREVLRIFKGQRRAIALEEALLDDLAAVADPETAALKRRYRADFVAAFREALAALEARDRTLLRYQVIDGLGVSAIGAIYQVHRATAARWLAKVRDQLAADTQRRLGARLGLGRAETESLMRLVRSSMDLSIVSLLAEP